MRTKWSPQENSEKLYIERKENFHAEIVTFYSVFVLKSSRQKFV